MVEVTPFKNNARTGILRSSRKREIFFRKSDGGFRKWESHPYFKLLSLSSQKANEKSCDMSLFLSIWLLDSDYIQQLFISSLIQDFLGQLGIVWFANFGPFFPLVNLGAFFQISVCLQILIIFSRF